MSHKMIRNKLQFYKSAATVECYTAVLIKVYWVDEVSLLQLQFPNENLLLSLTVKC